MNPDTEKAWRDEFEKEMKIDEASRACFAQTGDYDTFTDIESWNAYLAACKARTEEQRKKNERALEALELITQFVEDKTTSTFPEWAFTKENIRTIKTALEAK